MSGRTAVDDVFWRASTGSVVMSRFSHLCVWSAQVSVDEACGP
jgi:hypothetical protein